MKTIAPLFICVFLMFPVIILAANKDSLAPVRQPIYKNVIKFNPTPMILWDANNITSSYERIINPRQSASIELGYLVLPQSFLYKKITTDFTDLHRFNHRLSVFRGDFLKSLHLCILYLYTLKYHIIEFIFG